MSDLRARREAREQVDAAVWRLNSLLEDMETDRNRWRSLAVGWPREALAGNRISRASAEQIIAAAELEARG